ncbi:acetylglutamate kinase [Marinoscillum sp. MHG1-6]|uniref:acetylglutamate kinase n=1 Tax=Marinoscillum sp. MHG1-6 TaxID=2959627 RepID=UPI002157033C|nr:acetylglutamate kinase [Marinoscillum sp. MHG1-6]
MEKLNVIKIGGAVVDDPIMFADFLAEFKKISGYKILVHGGGRVATQMGEKLGVSPKIIEGRRITDEVTIEIVTMVYAGLVNKRTVAQLQSQGMNALGLSGADGNAILAKKRPVKAGIDYGLVGDIREVNVSFLTNLLDSGTVPVIAPLTHDGYGQLLNTNADTIASEVAIGLSSKFDVVLSMTFEMPGVLEDVSDPSTLIKTLNKEEYEVLKSEFKVHDGMIPKLDNAFNVIDNGVKSVRICKFDEIGDPENGTILQA